MAQRTVGGRALIDHVIDRFVEAGVKRAVVNVHAFADLLEAHVKRRRDIEIVISDERARLMETGGGVRQARKLLGDDPVFVANIDSVWEEPHGSAVSRLAKAFDPGRMSAQLMLAELSQQLGYDGAGDFFMRDRGALEFRNDRPSAPWAYMGVQIIDPFIVDLELLAPFSFTRVWRRLAAEGRLHGAPLGGYWMHVGDPRTREQAEARLRTAAASP